MGSHYGHTRARTQHFAWKWIVVRKKNDLERNENQGCWVFTLVSLIQAVATIVITSQLLICNNNCHLGNQKIKIQIQESGH